MDNFEFVFTGDSIESLKTAITLLPYRQTAAWKVVRRQGLPSYLILYWHAESVAKTGVVPFPSPVDSDIVADFVWAWLRAQDYGPEPDHDGSNEKGFRMWTEAWGRVDDETYSYIAIRPLWTWYGK